MQLHLSASCSHVILSAPWHGHCTAKMLGSPTTVQQAPTYQRLESTAASTVLCQTVSGTTCYERKPAVHGINHKSGFLLGHQGPSLADILPPP